MQVLQDFLLQLLVVAAIIFSFIASFIACFILLVIGALVVAAWAMLLADFHRETRRNDNAKTERMEIE